MMKKTKLLCFGGVLMAAALYLALFVRGIPEEGVGAFFGAAAPWLCLGLGTACVLASAGEKKN